MSLYCCLPLLKTTLYQLACSEVSCVFFSLVVFNSYFVTSLFPSTALMPMEYCLPLMDTFDCVEDLEFVESYRDYVKERTGVELIIVC